MRISIFIVIAVCALSSVNSANATEKPFRRSLIISGGGLAPGAGLGILAGLKAGGYEPDVVFLTCGSSISASLYNGFDSPEAAYAYARSPEYFRVLQNLIQIEERSALNIRDRLNWSAANPEILPQFFSGNLLRIPESVPRLLAQERFPTQAGGPRFVVLAAKAFFDSSHAGIRASEHTLYRQVYFTDPQTARHLRGRRSTIKRKFPQSYVDSRTEVISNVSMVQAARASVSDPYFVNPARIGNSYYFTGAIDLFPIETAKSLADEVMVTYPNLKYSGLEVIAMQSAFGFNPSQAAQWASRQGGVSWIAPYTVNGLNFDPRPWGISIVSSIPSSAGEFAARVDQQYEMAYAEGYKAARKHIARAKRAVN